MALNITSQIPELAGLTNTCYEWCVQQHYVHAFQNFQLLTSAIGLLFFSMLVFWYGIKSGRKDIMWVASLIISIGILEIVAFIILETK